MFYVLTRLECAGSSTDDCCLVWRGIEPVPLMVPLGPISSFCLIALCATYVCSGSCAAWPRLPFLLFFSACPMPLDPCPKCTYLSMHFVINLDIQAFLQWTHFFTRSKSGPLRGGKPQFEHRALVGYCTLNLEVVQHDFCRTPSFVHTVLCKHKLAHTGAPRLVWP